MNKQTIREIKEMRKESFKQGYWKCLDKVKWALEFAKPKPNILDYNKYSKDVLQLLEEEIEVTNKEK